MQILSYRKLRLLLSLAACLLIDAAILHFLGPFSIPINILGVLGVSVQFWACAEFSTWGSDSETLDLDDVTDIFRTEKSLRKKELKKKLKGIDALKNNVLYEYVNNNLTRDQADERLDFLDDRAVKEMKAANAIALPSGEKEDDDDFLSIDFPPKREQTQEEEELIIINESKYFNS